MTTQKTKSKKAPAKTREIDIATLNSENWKNVIVPAQLSLNQLIDLTGELKGRLKFLDKVEGYIKEVLKAKLECDKEYNTGKWIALQESRTKVYLAADTAKELLGEEVYTANLTSTSYTQLTIKPIVEDK